MLYFPALLIQDLRENRKNNRNRAKWLFACRPSKSVSQQVQLLGQQGSHRVPIGLKYMHTQRIFQNIASEVARLPSDLELRSCGIKPGSNPLVDLVCTIAASNSKVFEVHRSILRYVTLHKLQRARRQSIHCMQSEVMFGGAPI